MLGIEKTKLKDFWLVMLSFPLTAGFSILINANFFLMGILFMGLPVILLGFREKQYLKKYSIEALAFSVVCVGVFDYVGTVSQSWTERTIFSIKFLGVVPLDTFVWGFSYVLLSLLFYSYFFDTDKTLGFNRKTKKALFGLIGVSTVFFLIYFINKQLLVINYMYFYLSLLFTTVLAVGYYKYPHLYKKIVIVALVLLTPWFIHEFTSLYLGHWVFNEGHHLGYIRPFGYLIPYEEIYWLIVVVPCFIILHEVYADNRKN